MPLYRTRKDDYGEERKLLVERNIHAYKYDTFFGISDPHRNPVINPPERNPCDCPPMFAEKMEKQVKGLIIFVKIFPIIIKKYPEFVDRKKFERLAGVMKTYVEYVKPIIDGRWDRSWAEWEQIIEYAKVWGSNAASRKFSAIKNGKEKYLSPSHIKQKIKEQDKFNKKFKDIPYFADYGKKLIEIVKSDAEVREKYIQLAKEYDENKVQVISQMCNGGSKIYPYSYYYIRHYDPGKYQQRKSDYKKGKLKKSSVNGKIECGPFKDKDFPPGSIERLQLQKEKVIQLYSKILFILSFRPFTTSSITGIIATETRDMIKSMLEELRITGLVEKMNYSDNKPEIADELSENSSASDVDNNVYYILNRLILVQR
jgi:hypothetical protein